ncbi:MAG: hypothetical protein ACXW11_06975 [Methylotenera sp.]
MKWLSKKQWMMLGLVVLVTVASSDWQDVNPVGSKLATSVAQATVQRADRPVLRNKASVMEVADVRLDRLGNRVISGVEMINVFKSKSWFVPPPPPPPPKPVPPLRPTAPPLPYAFLGSYQEPGGHLIIFLTRGERVYSVSPGDIIENTYHVDGVAAGLLGLTYLPLNIKQTMNIGEAS